MIDWLLGQVPGFLLDFVVASINGLWALLAQTVFITPDVTVLPQVQAISARSLAIVNVSYVLVITITGLFVMTRDTIQSRYGVAELGPRLVIGFLAANFATPISRTVIEFANALTRSLTGEDIASRDSLDQLLRVITNAMVHPANQLLVAIIGLFIAVLVAMLLVAWIVRLMVLIVVVGIAPIALALHASPLTDPVARLWWRSLLGCAGTVVLQALALHTNLSIFLDPAANLPAVGVPVDPTGTFNLFVVACLLWVTIRIPSMVRRYVTNGGNRNIAGYMIRLVIVQQLTRGLTRGLGQGLRSGATRHGPRMSLQSALRGDGYPRPPASSRTPRPSGTGWPQEPRPAIGPGLRGKTTGTGWPSSGSTPGRRSGGPVEPSNLPPTRGTSTGQPVDRQRPGSAIGPGTGWPASTSAPRPGRPGAIRPQTPHRRPGPPDPRGRK